MPDASDRFLQGGTAGIYHDAGLPNISGTILALSASHRNQASGAFSYTTNTNKQNTANGGEFWQEGYFTLDASTVSSIYKNDVLTVQPKSLELIFCIRY